MRRRKIAVLAMLLSVAMGRMVMAEEEIRFQTDLVYESPEHGSIHYNLYVPESYDASEPYALYIVLPGWGGLYFQGVGADLRESFPYAGQKYNPRMMVASLQLSDWGKTSAEQTIAMTEYLMEAFLVDPSRVYVSGYSGGGETLSLVLGMRPELYAAALHVSSKWDGDLTVLAAEETPLYLFIGEEDDYYGSESARETYEALSVLYREKGLTEEEIGERLVLDVRDEAWFAGKGVRSQHGGGGLAAGEAEVMNWLFSKQKGRTS